MVATTERRKLVTTYSVDASSLTKSLRQIDRSSASSARSLKSLDRAAKSLESSMDSLGRVSRGLAAVWAVSEILQFSRGLLQASDSIAQIEQQLEGLGAGALGFEELFNAAQRLGVPIEQLQENLNVLVPGLQRTGASFGESTQFVEDLTNSLRLFGVGGAQAASIVTQLGQGLTSGQLSGDELKSLRENAAGLGIEFEKAAQDILGVEDSLKDMGSQGLLTAEVVREAFEQVFENLGPSFDALPRSIEQQEAAMVNAWDRLWANLDKRFKGSEFYKSVLGFATDVINTISDAVSDVPSFTLTDPADLNRQREELAKITAQMEEMGGTVRGLSWAETRRFEALQDQADELRSNDPVAVLAEAREELITLENRLTQAIEQGSVRRQNSLAEEIDEQQELVLTLEEIVDASLGAGRYLEDLARKSKQVSEGTTETDKYKNSVKDLEEQLRKATGELSAFNRGGTQALETYRENRKVADAYLKALEDQGTTIQDATAEQHENARAVADTTAEILKQEKALKKSQEAAKQQVQTQNALAQAQAGAAQAQSQLSAFRARGQRGLDQAQKQQELAEAYNKALKDQGTTFLRASPRQLAHALQMTEALNKQLTAQENLNRAIEAGARVAAFEQRVAGIGISAGQAPIEDAGDVEERLSEARRSQLRGDTAQAQAILESVAAQVEAYASTIGDGAFDERELERMKKELLKTGDTILGDFEKAKEADFSIIEAGVSGAEFQAPIQFSEESVASAIGQLQEQLNQKPLEAPVTLIPLNTIQPGSGAGIPPGTNIANALNSAANAVGAN